MISFLLSTKGGAFGGIEVIYIKFNNMNFEII